MAGYYQNKNCIDACLQCAAICNHCAANCLQGQDVQMRQDASSFAMNAQFYAMLQHR